MLKNNFTEYLLDSIMDILFHFSSKLDLVENSNFCKPIFTQQDFFDETSVTVIYNIVD